MAFVLDRYGDDLVESSLKVQLESFTTAFIPAAEKPTFTAVKTFIISLSPAQRGAMSEVCTVLKLIMVISATNAVSERSASALCRVKMYLQSTMS